MVYWVSTSTSTRGIFVFSIKRIALQSTLQPFKKSHVRILVLHLVIKVFQTLQVQTPEEPAVSFSELLGLLVGHDHLLEAAKDAQTDQGVL